jgi:glycosyltransferase involved in cell wall biosynthesis
VDARLAPTISVLLPARNAAGTLEEALGSLAAQTFEDWEAIVVDDASVDGTTDILEEWARRDRRFRLLRNLEHEGIVSSLNRAAGEARAPVLARMDADDISLPERFERQLGELRGTGAALVGCRVRYFPDDLVQGGARRYEEWLNSILSAGDHARDVFIECPVAHPTMMLRAEAFRAAGGYQDHGWPEDYDLCLRLWSAGLPIAKVPEVLFLWREHPQRASRTHPEYGLDAFYRCKAHFLRNTHLREKPALVFAAGPVGKAMARALLEEGVTLQAFVDLDPRKIGQQIYGLPVLSQPEGFSLRGKAFGLAAVGQPAGREVLRAELKAAGWIDGEDFCCVA